MHLWEILLTNFLSSLPISLANPIWWWAHLAFDTMARTVLFALAFGPAILGLMISMGLGRLASRVQTVFEPQALPYIQPIFCTALLIPGLPFVPMLAFLAAAFAVPLRKLFICAAIGRALTYFIAVYITKDSAILGWLITSTGLL